MVCRANAQSVLRRLIKCFGRICLILRLDELVNRNELVRIGQARAARYALPPRTPEANIAESDAEGKGRQDQAGGAATRRVTGPLTGVSTPIRTLFR